VRAVFERPAHDYTRALLDAIPRLGSMAGKAAPEKLEAVESGR